MKSAASSTISTSLNEPLQSHTLSQAALQSSLSLCILWHLHKCVGATGKWHQGCDVPAASLPCKFQPLLDADSPGPSTFLWCYLWMLLSPKCSASFGGLGRISHRNGATQMLAVMSLTFTPVVLTASNLHTGSLISTTVKHLAKQGFCLLQKSCIMVCDIRELLVNVTKYKESTAWTFLLHHQTNAACAWTIKCAKQLWYPFLIKLWSRNTAFSCSINRCIQHRHKITQKSSSVEMVQQFGLCTWDRQHVFA